MKYRYIFACVEAIPGAIFSFFFIYALFLLLRKFTLY